MWAAGGWERAGTTNRVGAGVTLQDTVADDDAYEVEGLCASEFLQGPAPDCFQVALHECLHGVKSVDGTSTKYVAAQICETVYSDEDCEGGMAVHEQLAAPDDRVCVVLTLLPKTQEFQGGNETSYDL